MSIDIELLPCPHCGGAAQIDEDHDDRGNRVIECSECYASVGANSFKVGAERWNRRASIPQAPTKQPPQRRAPSTAEHDIGMAHIICDEAGIPQGEIIRRLTRLSEKGDAAGGAQGDEVKKLPHGHREDFYLMANCRGMLAQKYARKPNWVIAMDLFATGSASAHAICHEAGIDPDGTKIERATATPTKD